MQAGVRVEAHPCAEKSSPAPHRVPTAHVTTLPPSQTRAGVLGSSSRWLLQRTIVETQEASE
eukprot:2493486-Rhodomonas_salina.2